jgi:large subunit ribosomal protein L29
MSAKELREKSPADLQKELLGLRREQFNLRMARATGQTAKPDQFTKVRKNIARLKTVVGEQRRAAAAGQPAPAVKAAVAKPAAPKKAAAKKAAKKADEKGKSA